MQSRSRRGVAALSCLALLGCGSAPPAPLPWTRQTPPAALQMRAPAVGQQWVYRVRNLYNGRIEDEITETVVSIAPEIVLRRVSRRDGPLSDEIESSWGSVVQDSHWDLPMRFDTPLPSWPEHIALGDSQTFRDRYRLLEDLPFGRRWDVTMTTVDWGTIRVPAGEFAALEIFDRIHYTSHDPYFIESDRTQWDWVAPAVGRWVVRRTYGVDILPARGGEMPQDFRQWELVSWR